MPKKRARTKDISFDEIAIDNVSAGTSRRERPVRNIIFMATAGLFSVFCLLVFLRVFYLGGIKFNFYKAKADSNVNKITITSAERGFILDRYGNKIVDNAPSLSLRLRPSELIKFNEAEAVESIAGNLNISKEDLDEIFSKSDLQGSSEIIIKKEISSQEAILVEGSGLKSLYVAKDNKRIFDPEFAHIVGYVGFPTKGEIFERELTSVDVIGKTNLEKKYDSLLRGINGENVVYRNVKGESLGTHTFSEPKKGNDLTTTIDAGLQKFFYSRLQKALEGAGPGGVGIAINPLNGDVLSLVSIPSFSSSDISESLVDPNKPLFNRAVTGLYSPGSTIKTVIAAGALKDGVIDTDEMVLSTGHLDIPNKYHPEYPTRFVDWKAHGWVDVYSALARSSNIFFYAVGGGLPYNLDLFMGDSDLSSGLGINGLKKYYSIFRLDKKTGIDLSGESEGYLPSAEDKKERTGIDWTIGDTYNVSIGQGDLVVTPISLINAVSSIVNGGKIFKPNLILGKESEILDDISYLSKELSEVVVGMKDAVNKSYGTASMLNSLPFETCAKTGSAQVMNNTQTNAFFVGCGPFPLKEEENPICVLVLVEQAKEGGLNAVPVAYDVFKWYYDSRINPVQNGQDATE